MRTSNSWYRSWHTCIIATVEAEVHSSSVSVVYAERLRIVFSKAASAKEGLHGTQGTPSVSATAARLEPHIARSPSWYKVLIAQ